MNSMRLFPKSIVLMSLMLISALVAFAVRPTIKLADRQAAVQLEKVIPESFGDWRELQQNYSQIVNPLEQQALNEIYSQTLSKTYINSTGYRIMLSIAFTWPDVLGRYERLLEQYLAGIPVKPVRRF